MGETEKSAPEVQPLSEAFAPAPQPVPRSAKSVGWALALVPAGLLVGGTTGLFLDGALWIAANAVAGALAAAALGYATGGKLLGELNDELKAESDDRRPNYVVIRGFFGAFFGAVLGGVAGAFATSHFGESVARDVAILAGCALGLVGGIGAGAYFGALENLMEYGRRRKAPPEG